MPGQNELLAIDSIEILQIYNSQKTTKKWHFVTQLHFIFYISLVLISATSTYLHRIERLPRWICGQDEFHSLLIKILHCSRRFKNHEEESNESTTKYFGVVLDF